VKADIYNANGICLTFCADVTDEDKVIKFFKDTVDEWGHLDILVNSAGRDSLSPPVSEVTLEEWNKTIGPNMTGVFYAAVRHSDIWKNRSPAVELLT